MCQLPPWVTSAKASSPKPASPISMPVKLSTSSGWVAASRKTVPPLMSWPVRWTGPRPRCRISWCRSSAAVPLSYRPGALAESPKPRRSTANYAVVPGQPGDDLVKGPPGLREPVDQQDR